MMQQIVQEPSNTTSKTPGADTIRILIADKLAPEGAAFLEQQPDVQVTSKTGLEGDALAEALAEHDGVVIRSAVKIREDVLKRAVSTGKCRLRGIARAGVGVDNIDLDAATNHGIVVMNSASASTITTAEQAFALMIGLARNIGPAYKTMSEGGWDRSKYVGKQLHGRTLGVVGLGRIGQTMAHRAMAFGMNVVGFDPFINADSALDGQVPLVKSFDDLISQVDVVSFHVPKTDDTKNMLSTAQFEKAKDGLLVVNAARGGIIDEKAMLEALDSGKCGGAAIDVYESEPPAEDDPLRAHPKVLCTPHLGASTVEAQEAVAVDACKALLMYLRGEGASGALNVRGLDLNLTDRQKALTDLSRRMIGLLDAAEDVSRIKAVKVHSRGDAVSSRAETIARFALADLLRRHLDEPVNVINAGLLAEHRRIDFSTVIAGEADDEDRIAIEIIGEDRTIRVEGAMYADEQPRVTNINGYTMDMIPAGPMVLLTNKDEPGRIGLVGRIFGESKTNIAEMVIGRRQRGEGQVALMILKLDQTPSDEVLKNLRDADGILSVAALELPEVNPELAMQE